MEEELKERFIKLADSYRDSPQNQAEILLPFYKELSQLPAKERYALRETASSLHVRTRKDRNGNIVEWRPCSDDCRMFLSAMGLLVDNPRSALLPVMFNFHVPLLCALLEIYCPSWIKHMKFRPDAGGSNISYLTYMTLTDRGFVETIDEPLLAQIVGELPWHNHDNTGKIFLERKELLDEHVWLLFRYNTPVAWNDDTAISAFAEGRTKNNGSLQALLLNRAAEGRIDRTRLLKSSLDALVAIRSQPRWFIGIIEGLQPTAAELLSLQALLFQGLVAKALGSMKLLLHLLRQIATEPAFNYTDYISVVSGLLYDMAQTNVTVVCATFDIIARLHACARPDICRALCLIFMNRAEAVQKRAAKLIVKYGDKNDEALRSELRSYETEMRQGPREMLAAFMPREDNASSTAAEEAPSAIVPLKRCRENDRLKLPENKDEAIFLLSSALFKFDALQLQLAFETAIEWAPRLTIDDLNRLESMFNEARAWSSAVYLDENRLVGLFFLEFGRAVEQRFKTDDTSMKSRLLRLADKARGQGCFQGETFTRLKSCKVRGNCSDVETLLKHLLSEYVEMLSFDAPLPILSTPTHKPAWINAEILIERLAEWQQAGVQPLPFDLQLALLRCAADDVPAALSMAHKLLTGEPLHLMLYLLGEESEPAKPVTLDEAWAQAILIREENKSTDADFSSELAREVNIMTKVNREWTDHKRKTYDRDVLVCMASADEFPALRKKQLLQNFIDIRGIWAQFVAQSVISFFPALPAPLFATILHNYGVFSNLHADDKMWVGFGLSFLHEAQVPLRGVPAIFVAFCIASSDATLRVSAIELCMERRLQTYGERPAIDLSMVGEALACFLKNGLFPLSRLAKLLKDRYWGQEKLLMLYLGELLLPVNTLLSAQAVTGGKAFLKLCKEMGIATENTAEA